MIDMTERAPDRQSPCPAQTHGQMPAENWDLYRALRSVAKTYNLRPAHLQTLQAMLSLLKPGHGLVVFASNATLCARAGGIDERTLRRHVSRLIQQGLIVRQDSPNRKRYRVRFEEDCVSFGFSLAPLFRRSQEIIQHAEDQHRTEAAARLARARIFARLAALDAALPNCPRLAELRRVLRRKLSLTDYQSIEADLPENVPDIAQEPPLLSAEDGQNDRHLSKSETKDIDKKSEDAKQALDFQQLLSSTSEVQAMFPGELKTWHDALRLADRIAPMLGLDPHLCDKATLRQGPRKTACLVLLITQMHHRIRNIPAYFHSLTLGQKADRLSLSRLMTRLAATAA